MVEWLDVMDDDCDVLTDHWTDINFEEERIWVCPHTCTACGAFDIDHDTKPCASCGYDLSEAGRRIKAAVLAKLAEIKSS